MEINIIKIKLNENERYIKYDKNMGLVIVEIKENDKIKENYFLQSDKNNNINYKNKEIFYQYFHKMKILIILKVN